MRILSILFLLASVSFPQQYEIRGIVKDSSSGEYLGLANIFVQENNIGTSTNSFGSFVIPNLKKGHYTLEISFLGYKSNVFNIELISDTLLTIDLQVIPLKINGMIIEGTYPRFRETAVAFSELSDKDIEYRLGSKEAVNILNGTPSSYISQQGGGIGEQRLNLRGFDQTNIAVMINGIPINNPENGEIYWSNWAGISDIIKYVHVQRGLSAIPYSTASIGGNVNFVTLGLPSLKPQFKFSSEFGSYHLLKNTFSFSTMLSEGFSITGLLSKRNMEGFADQVYSDEMTYFLALNMLRSDHSFQVQLFGSPQEHGQRLTSQTIEVWEKRGKRYNADWGYLKGKPLNLRDNEFHNPTLNVNHNWQISENLILTNILSLSRGSGGGTVPPWYPELTRTDDGLINFDREWILNSNNIDTRYDPSLNRSIIALRKGVHKNYWGNFISSLKYNWKNFILSTGVDVKLYKAQNYNELNNLLGGDYYIFSGDVNDDPNRLLSVGDKVDFFAESFTRSYGGFLQLEFNRGALNSFLNFSLSNTEYNRIDYFNYVNNDPKRESGWKNFLSTNVKMGANYNVDKYNSVFVNVGTFSRAPLSDNVYDYSNNLYENVKNERVNSIEVGYGLQTSFAKINLNYYFTNWHDKAFSQSFLNTDSTAIYYYNIFGASAEHSGIEFEGKFNIAKFLTLNTMFSYAINKWTSDVDAYVRPESNPVDEIKYRAFTKSLFVGNHPMTTASLGIFYQYPFSQSFEFFINPVYNFYGRYYSKFDPELRTNEDEKRIQPWRIPDFYNIDVHTGIKIKLTDFFIKSLDLSFDLFNIFNKDYIIDAIDGSTHDSNSSRVWYGNERYWNLSFSAEI